VSIDIFRWDVTVFFEELAGNGGEVIGEVFVVPGVFFGVPLES
jgi:hypothetical protein